ncbi:transposase [Marinilabiliaceae bacterium ANBcel2]|nr:transposase [Marinilabiliaceae bacterium ANBcel2]
MLHADRYIVYPKNLGPYLTIDETALSNGELYTIITNKARKGKKGTIVGMFKGTQSNDIIKLILEHYPAQQRKIVREVTLDMAGNMNLIVKKCFPKATRVIDRFHVQKLAYEAVQDVRIKHRWETLDAENKAYKEAKAKGIEYKPEILANGDTRKQLLARSRYLLFKPEERWTLAQWHRAQIIFELYPDIKKAYKLAYNLYEIYNWKIRPDIARTKLAHWFNHIENAGFNAFMTIRRTFETHHDTIINYFNSRSTNAAAESFNAKIKDFRREFRGVVDVKFFLYRLCKIYA